MIMRRRARVFGVALLIWAGTRPAWGQEIPLELRHEPLPPTETSGVIQLLRQEDEKAVREPAPAPSLEPVGRAPRGTPNVGFGPLSISSQSPLHALRMGTAPEGPLLLAPGRWEARENLTWSRMWAQADDYLLSFETLGRACSVAHGVTERLQLELGVVETARFSGDLDGFVKNFHETFDLGQGGRDTIEEGSYEFQVGNVRIQEGASGETTRNLFAAAHYTLTEGSDAVPAIAATLKVGSALGDSPDLRGDSVGVAGSLTVSKGWGDLYAYLGAGFAWYGRESFHGLPLRPFGASILTALEWRFLAGASLIVQHLWTPGALEGYEDLSRPSYELGLGLKIQAAEGAVIEIGMTENILVFDSSPDFGLHAGLSVRF
ncbi:MAG TPA: DUF3187 family protein [Planctomycetota bacterium]